MLNKITAGLALLTSFIHIFLGGKDALDPMLAAGLSLPAEAAMHACWHMVSCFLLWSVVVFFKGGKPVFHFGLFWLVSAIIFIYIGLTQAGFDGLVVNPQWTILGLTGVLAVWNTRMRTAW